MMHLLVTFLLSTAVWGNPFSAYIIPKKESSTLFHEIKRPFAYPFEQSGNVQTGELDTKKIEKVFEKDIFSRFKEIYKDFPLDKKTSVYAYPFPIHPNWEILPYPYVGPEKQVEAEKWVSEFGKELPFNQGVRSYSFHEKLNSLTQSRAYAGNKLKLLRTPESMDVIYRLLEQARHHVLISSFLFQCDPGMNQFLKTLERKVQEGVEVYLIYDQKFSLTNPKCIKNLRRIGVKVALHHAKGPLYVFHEKMMVFDGKYGLVLGQNMLASQVLSTGTNNLINDMAIGTEGPMVGVIAQRFLQHWQDVSKNKMSPQLVSFYEELNRKNDDFSRPDVIKKALWEGKGLCRLVGQSPGKKNRNISNLYFETVKETKNYLFFNMIDVAFRNIQGKKINERFLREVSLKVNETEGMRVDMLTNNWKLPTDVKTSNGQGISPNLFSKISVAMGKLVTKRPHREIPRTLESLRSVVKSDNFHWWSYSQYMHGKTLMSDNIYSLVGSYNINQTSELSSFELVMACLDTDLAKEFQKSIVLDNLNSIPLEL